MSVQLGRLSKASTTIMTNVRLLSRVDSDVVVEGCGTCKSSSTVTTFVGSFSRVGYNVSPQGAREGEALAAVSTLVRTLSVSTLPHQQLSLWQERVR